MNQASPFSIIMKTKKIENCAFERTPDRGRGDDNSAWNDEIRISKMKMKTAES
jgi:hypothetical protein